jgi:hypothetical protein
MSDREGKAMREAIDWVQVERPLEVRPTKPTRTQLQIAMLAEDTWLAPHLIATDLYICPSEAMAKMRKGGSR